jgi:sugar phosphate isomerase/epimerase
LSEIRIGVQLASLRLPFKQALHAVASMGVHGIEIDARNDLRPAEVTGTALRQVRKLLDDLNLRVVSVRFLTRRGFDCMDQLDRRVAATKDAMRMAYQLGASVLVNQIGMVTSDLESPSRQILQGVLNDLSRHGQHVGCQVGCETGSEPLPDLLGLVAGLPDALIGIVLNPGNLLVNGFDLKELRAAAPHILLVHAKDGVRDLARGRGVEVPLGRGLAEFPEIAATLEEHRYTGYYVVERESSKAPMEDVQQAVSFLRNM